MAIHEVKSEYSRLDTVVLNHYGDLSMFDAVFKANTALTNIFLFVGDVVYLPEKTQEQEEESLW